MKNVVQVKCRWKIVHKKNQVGRVKNRGLQLSQEGVATENRRIPEGEKPVVVGLGNKIFHRIVVLRHIPEKKCVIAE